MNASNEPFQLAPISEPSGLASSNSEAVTSANHKWKHAPKVVKWCGFWLTILSSLPMLLGLTMVASASGYKVITGDPSGIETESIWLLFSTTMLLIVFGFHLVALYHGWKFSYYFQLVWSSILILSFIGHMNMWLSGDVAFAHLSLKWDDGLWSLVKISTALINIVSYLSLPVIFMGWFKPEVKAWFGIRQKPK